VDVETPNGKNRILEEISVLESEIKNTKVPSIEDEDYIDYESIDVLKKHKMQRFEMIIRDYVNIKYKISFFKGMQMVLETLVLLVIMLSICKKANVFSLFYLLFIIRYITSQAKTQLLVHIVFYINCFFILQYAIYLLNMNQNMVPQ
jgi:hypothetical protein